MTRFIHDQFAKQYLTELLTPLGQVETSKDITAEVRQIDVFLLRSSPPKGNPSLLGLLGRLAATSAVFEPFRNPVTRREIRSCLGKLFDIQAQLERLANRENTRLNEAELPRLWILSPTASVELLQSFKATTDEENWMSGIYFLGEALKTAIIAIHQLPRTPETLWLRILGRGRVQQQAIQELETLPENNPLRSSTLELVYDLLAVLEARQQQAQDLDQDDRELIMQLSPIYRQRLEEATQQGIQKGIQQERRAMIEGLLRTRFGSIDEQLEAIIEPAIALPAEELTSLLLQLSRSELIARFGQSN